MLLALSSPPSPLFPLLLLAVLLLSSVVKAVQQHCPLEVLFFEWHHQTLPSLLHPDLGPHLLQDRGPRQGLQGPQELRI